MQLAELIALLMMTLDEVGSLRKGLNESDDRQELVIAMGEELIADVDEAPIKVRARKIITALALLQVLVKTIESIQYYSLSMGELVAKAAFGNGEAMVRAVSIDPTVLNCPPVALRFSLAVIAGDKKLLRRMSKAFGGPHKKDSGGRGRRRRSSDGGRGSGGPPQRPRPVKQWLVAMLERRREANAAPAVSVTERDE